VLLHGLDSVVARADRDTLIVLHQKGSHGPAYSRRYPPAFRRFLPACESNDLHECDRQAIVNAYDNTISYTDHVLAELIDLLRSHSERLDTGLLYVSDHGESLGENGVYLHGLPYAIAPDEQTRVPFIVWFSAGWAMDTGLDLRCVSGQRDAPAGHENLSQTVLGLMDVESEVYQPTLDLFAACRTAAGG
jgi:lipid A ethanolaminephosphotransferase